MTQTDNGLVKNVSEQYLVDAMTFTEAESRLIEELAEGRKEFTVMSVARSQIKDVIYYGDTELWFKCKVSYTTVDPESEKEKKVSTLALVNAQDVGEAWERILEHLESMLVPFTVNKVEESPIVEVIEYKKRAKKKKEEE